MTDKPLPEPIKIKWAGDARTKLLTREIEPATADEILPECAFYPMTRQTTQIVIETHNELDAIENALSWARERSSRSTTWMSPAHERAYDRVHRELAQAADNLKR